MAIPPGYASEEDYKACQRDLMMFGTFIRDEAGRHVPLEAVLRASPSAKPLAAVRKLQTLRKPNHPDMDPMDPTPPEVRKLLKAIRAPLFDPNAPTYLPKAIYDAAAAEGIDLTGYAVTPYLGDESQNSDS